MISFETITHFRERLQALMDYKYSHRADSPEPRYDTDAG